MSALQTLTAREYNTYVKDFSDNAFRFAYTLVRQRETAEDIVQDVFLKLWETGGNVCKEKIKSWIFSSVYHKSIDCLRKQRNFDAIDGCKEEVYQPQMMIKEELDKFLQQLPAVQKSVLVLKDEEGYKYEEISQILNLSMEQVKVYLYRARKQMQQMIKTKDNLL